MPSTLILSDVTLAVRGAPSGDPPEQHLRRRVAEVAAFDRQKVADCAEILLASAGGEEANPDALESLVILGLAHSEVAADLGISTPAHARRLALRLERQARGGHARAVLEAAARAFPRDRSVSRDLAALIRRQEVARDSVQRCLDRARRLIEKGRHGEAVPWLQEVLINDPSRKDVARTIRDLRFQVVEGSQARRRRWRLAASSLVLSLLASLAVLHELRLRAEFQTLPEIRERSLASMRERLGALDEFTERHPIWHGTLLVLSERSALDVEIDRIEEAISMAQDLRGVEQTRRIEEANLLRERGRVRAEAGDYESALAELRRSLELATPDWRHRDRVEKDIQAIRQAQEKRP